ncbi:hypothetical protein NCC49_005301 [Naganishia albida]|nr:hypothetical protein NCC49_005301 [Naganishia albida]
MPNQQASYWLTGKTLDQSVEHWRAEVARLTEVGGTIADNATALMKEAGNPGAAILSPAGKWHERLETHSQEEKRWFTEYGEAVQNLAAAERALKLGGDGSDDESASFTPPESDAGTDSAPEKNSQVAPADGSNEAANSFAAQDLSALSEMERVALGSLAFQKSIAELTRTLCDKISALTRASTGAL